MPSLPAPQAFPARFEELPKLLATAEAGCTAAGFGDEARHRVELVLEEAFSNSVRHGFPETTSGSVWLAWEILPDGLRIVYRDDALPFDPLDGACVPTSGEVGGVGRMLIKSLPRRVQYVGGDGRNELILEFGR